jgi:hypothetical protein
MNDGQMLFPTSSSGVLNYTPGSSDRIPYRELTYTSTGRLSFEGSQQGSSLGKTYYVIYPVPSDNKAATTEEKGTAFRLFKKVDTPTPVQTTVSLDQTELSLEVGKTATLTATVTPDTVGIKEWKSSDIKVATVENGLVTAIKEGTAKITVITNDNKSAECTVTVSKAEGGDTPGGDTPGGDTPGGDTPSGDTPSGDTPSGDTPSGNTPSGNTPSGDTPSGDTPSGNTPSGNNSESNSGNKADTPTTNTQQPSAEEFKNAPVDNSLPVINPEKIKTTGSMKNQTMTIKLGKVNIDNCLVEYRQAGAKTWKSVWYGKGSQLVIKGMKKNGFYQYRFTTVKLVNGKWKKGKPSNICYRWIKNVKAKKPVAGKKKITVKWKKVKKVNGYEIQYARNKAFTKSAKKVTVKGAKKTKKTIKGLKKGKTYYVRIRPFKKKGGKKYLGIYTVAKKVKVK